RDGIAPTGQPCRAVRRLLGEAHEPDAAASGSSRLRPQGNSLMRMRRNSNFPVSDCRPMPPVAPTLNACSITSPLHLHRATVPTATETLVTSMALPFSFAWGLPSLTVSSRTSLSVTGLPLTVVVTTPPLTVTSRSFQSPMLNLTLGYGPTVG